MKDNHFNLLRWAPVAASAVLVILITVISAATVAELKKATYWRKNTFDVVLNAQTYEDSLIHAQGHIQRYVAGGTHSLLVEYQNDTNSELQEFNRLTELTRDNPEQQKRLKDLNAAVRAVFDYDNRVVGVYARQGAKAALKMEESSDNVDTLGAAIKDLENFKDEEKKQLDKSDATEEKDYHKAAHVLIAGSILAAVLLVFSNFIASREMARRRHAEQQQRELIEQLQKTLAEVKTLSGLIPICGWCKKVRSDEGFWQSVEHYVSSHTDATFTHGMCPNCAGGWKSDVAKAGKDSKTELPR